MPPRTSESRSCTGLELIALSRLPVAFSAFRAALLRATSAQTPPCEVPRRSSCWIDCGTSSLADPKLASPDQRWASTQNTSRSTRWPGARIRSLRTVRVCLPPEMTSPPRIRMCSVAAAVLDDHGGHAPAALLADHQDAAGDGLIHGQPRPAEVRSARQEDRIDRQAAEDDRLGDLDAVEVSAQFRHVAIGRGALSPRGRAA